MAATLILFHLCVYAYFWQWRGWNESSRLVLTYAIVGHGTIAVDALHTQSSDLAFVEGRYYTYKPPGQSLLGVPVYAVLHWGGVSHPDVRGDRFGHEPRPLWDAARQQGQVRYWWPDYVLTLATSGVLTAVLVALVYHAALRLGCSQRSAVLVAVCYGLGTPALTHATLYCGHQVAAALAFAAWMLVWRSDDCSAWRCLAAGMLAGSALLCEYAMLFTVVGIGVVVWWSGARGLNFLLFCAAVATCAIALGIYHSIVFGAPWATGYPHSVVAEYRELYSGGVGSALVAPTLERAGKILLSGRGLVWYAPAVLLAPAGTWLLFRQRQYQAVFITIVSFGSYFIINASHPTWEGGAATGPRYLLASMPFLMPPIAGCLVRGGKAIRFVLAASGLAGGLVCLTCAAIPEGGRLPHLGPGGDDPLRNLVWNRVTAGEFGRNLGNVLFWGRWSGPAVRNWWSLLPLVSLMALGGVVLALKTQPGRPAWHGSKVVPP